MATTKSPPKKLDRSKVPEGHVLCEYCTAKCCRYFALPIDRPKKRKDFEFIRWYLVHDRASMFVEDGGGDTTHADGLLFVIIGKATLARCLQIIKQGLTAGQGAFGQGRQFDAPDNGGGFVLGHGSEQCLADTGAMQRRAGAGIGQGPHQRPAFHLAEIEHGILVHHGEIDRFLRLFHQIAHDRAGNGHEIAIFEKGIAGAEGFHPHKPQAALIIVADEPLIGHRRQQAMRRRGGQRQLLRRVGEG